MPTPAEDQRRAEEIKRLLAQTPVVHNACDLDLLLFLHRHPRALLTSEQVAEFVGYSSKLIGAAIEAFIGDGLLERTSQHGTHAARMFLLQVDGQSQGGIRALLQLASSRQGRQSVLLELGAMHGHDGTPPTIVVQH